MLLFTGNIQEDLPRCIFHLMIDDLWWKRRVKLIITIMIDDMNDFLINTTIPLCYENTKAGSYGLYLTTLYGRNR